MPINTELTSKVWYRYAYARDNGLSDYVAKADMCERFFRGEQWSPVDIQLLKAQMRPALTINKIISTIGNVMGEQIYNRNEISFAPLNGAPGETADALRKVFKQISQNNQLDWRRSDMFADGAITSRGYLDVRLDFNDSMQGDVRVVNLNPKNVIPDPDAEEYDPDTWNEVMTTKWMTADDIAILYSKEDADLLRGREQSYFPYGYDSIEALRDHFGKTLAPAYTSVPSHEFLAVMRNMRVIERQHRKLDKQKHFVNIETGDMRPVPEGWDRDRIALMVKQFGFGVVTKLVRRIRWTVICDNVELHDDWSPYKHFTVVPYFPHFRRGQTIGLVENLLGPQELLNKVSSQELHVVNTVANSGWKIKAGNLVNMSLEELEQNGAKSGLVLELNDIEGAEKITPNATPQGLDRISYKAEEHIKTISGVSDSQQGMDRADVAAKAIQQKRQASSTNLVKPLDNLNRTDFILARNILDIVQEFYTEPRIITITHENGAGESESMHVNQPDPATGQIMNDLTLGEYAVVVVSVPSRETLEDSQFEQAMELKKEGVGIPDEVLIDSSRLMNKKDIIKKMQAASQSEEAKAQAALQQQAAQAEVAKTQAEAQQKSADAGLKQAKMQKETVAAQKEAATPPGEGDDSAAALMAKTQADIVLERERFEHDKEIDFDKMALERQKLEEKTRMDREKAAQQAVADRVKRVAERNTPKQRTS